MIWHVRMALEDLERLEMISLRLRNTKVMSLDERRGLSYAIDSVLERVEIVNVQGHEVHSD